MNPETLAPCVAVVGPANAGKTTLLHQLDEKLERRLDSFLILKGNPDGTGRYLYHAPDLRESLKEKVKGKWGGATVDQICEWTVHGRKNLSLALLDFGGRHDKDTAEGNARMLAACSHYIVVNREGRDSDAPLWDGVGREHGLIPLGWMRSQPKDGAGPVVISDEPSYCQAVFQVDAGPGDGRNDKALSPLVESLVALSRPVRQTPYINISRPERWSVDMIATVAGEAGRIEEHAARTGVVIIGGKAPVWAFLAALRVAIAAQPNVRVFFFDPRQPQRLVEIPAWQGEPARAGGGEFPSNALSLHWRRDGARSVLEFEVTTHDKFLPPAAAQNLEAAPLFPKPPSLDVALSGAIPMWLFGTYARWLIASGVERLASWDVGMKDYVQIWGR